VCVRSFVLPPLLTITDKLQQQFTEIVHRAV